MPARCDIQREIQTLRQHAQDLVRRRYIKQFSEKTGRDLILYASGAFSQRGSQVPRWHMSINTEDIHGFMAAVHQLKGDSLDLILHSPGGSAEAAEQIVNYLRAKYKHIRAIVPQNAMSAATMIACACDEILMGKQSAIGPIDPQMQMPSPSPPHVPVTIAAHALLDEFERAKMEMKAEPAFARAWVPKIAQYPSGILSACQTAIELAKEKVESWLASYMFKGEADAAVKAKDIANWLGDAKQHKSHGHPIDFQTAFDRKLKVVPLEADQQTQDLVLSILHATVITFEVTPCVKFIENQLGKGSFILASSPGAK